MGDSAKGVSRIVREAVRKEWMTPAGVANVVFISFFGLYILGSRIVELIGSFLGDEKAGFDWLIVLFVGGSLACVVIVGLLYERLVRPHPPSRKKSKSKN
jgi:hypothetical protein